MSRGLRLTEQDLLDRANKLRVKLGGEPLSSAQAKQILHPKADNPSFALGRLKPGTMNKTEAEYAQRLEYGKHTGAILWYRFEGITLKLADDTRYTPDFAVMIAGGEMQLHEVKGFWQDDAKVKIKVAASLFPFKFIAVRKLPKKEGGGWHNQEF